jgi:beta-glucosidase
VTGTFQGDVHGDILQANQDNAVPTIDGLDNVRHAVELSAGAHSIKIQVSRQLQRARSDAAQLVHAGSTSSGPCSGD